jgi:hypothetical protein
MYHRHQDNPRHPRHPGHVRHPGLTGTWRRRGHRRGAAAIMAMLYLVLFGTLVTGFFAAFTLATQTAYNERDGRRALAAAESGMEFIRLQLWMLDIQPDTPAEELFDEVYAQLSASLNGTATLSGGTIGRDGNTIEVPEDPKAYVALNDLGDGFRVSLTREGNELVVRVSSRLAGGASITSSRAVKLRYGIFERPSSIFDFGVASKSAINMVGNTSILGAPDPSSGSVLSTATTAYPLTMGSNCEISGEVSFSNPDAWVSAGKNSVINNEVGEPNWADNIHLVGEPDFPIVDTSDYLPLATTVITSSSPAGTEFVNILIPANTNPTFGSNAQFYGVIYIETPNQVKFTGHATLTGVIVTENDPSGDWTSNSIDFLGGVTATGPESLPAGDARFTAVREMGGAFVLADGFSVNFGGNVQTSIHGTIVASSISFSGTADATVTGSVINLQPDSAVTFNGTSSVTITSSGTKSQPYGLYFGSRYVPLPGSYEEAIP